MLALKAHVWQPACFCPMENSYRLVSSWDMLRFKAHHFIAASSLIGQIIMDLNSGNIPHPQSARAIDDNLAMISKYCLDLGLELSAEHAKRLNARELITEAMRTHDQSCLFRLQAGLAELQQRMCDEMKLRVYFQIPVSNAKYYEPDSPPFGQEVFDGFPSAIDDIVEAGNCLALNRNTAAVFHLMRVMEAGLKVLGGELGIPYAPSWESYLRQLTKAIESDWKSKSADVRKKQPLYKDLIGDLQSVKISWRNPTMHIVKKYGHDEAEQIYACVKQFMVRISEAGLAE